MPDNKNDIIESKPLNNAICNKCIQCKHIVMSSRVPFISCNRDGGGNNRTNKQPNGLPITRKQTACEQFVNRFIK